jgi:hypothetical protein
MDSGDSELMPEILAMEREKGGTERNVNVTHKDSAESGRNMAGGRNLSGQLRGR